MHDFHLPALAARKLGALADLALLAHRRQTRDSSFAMFSLSSKMSFNMSAILPGQTHLVHRQPDRKVALF